MNADFADGEGPASVGGPEPDTLELNEMGWDLDVDAFLDDYLKDVDQPPPDLFGTYGQGAAAQATPMVKTESGPSSSDGISDRLARHTLASASNTSAVARDSQPTSPPSRTKAAANRKQTALQEKNRRAQRRFRERQKMKVAELEEQVASLTSRVESLMSENAALMSRATAAESALVSATAAAASAAAAAAREERAAAEGATTVLDTAPRPTVTAGPAMSSSQPLTRVSGGGGPAAIEGTGSGIGGRGAAAGSAGGGTMGGDYAGTPAQPTGTAASAGPGITADDEGRLPVVFQGDLLLTLRDGAQLSLTAAQLREMTPAELARYYRTYVNELAQSLVEGGAPPGRVEALVDDVCRLWTRVGLCNPAGVKHFSLTRVEPAGVAGGGAGGGGVGAGGSPEDRVAAVSRALDLRPDQRASLARLRALFAGKLAGIRARRRGVLEALARAEPSGTGCRALAALYLASHEAARALREALREEHMLVLDFESTVFKHVLGGLQVAQLMIHSFPWTPDCLALSTWVAAEAGDADALSALALDAQRRAAASAAASAAAAAAAAAASSSAAGPPGGVPPLGLGLGPPGAPGGAPYLPAGTPVATPTGVDAVQAQQQQQQQQGHGPANPLSAYAPSPFLAVSDHSAKPMPSGIPGQSLHTTGSSGVGGPTCGLPFVSVGFTGMGSTGLAAHAMLPVHTSTN